MKQNRKSLQSVLKYRRWQEDSAARDLRKLSQARRNQQRRLDQLQRYLDEYRTGYERAVGRGEAGYRLAEYRQMIHTLEVAIQREKLNMACIINNWQKGRQEWQTASQRSSTMKSICDREAHKADLHAEGLEQLTLDDLSSRSRSRYSR